MSSEKRRLTTEEIEYILEDCHHRGLTREQNAAVLESGIKPIRDALEAAEVYPEIIPNLKEKITKKYYKSRAPGGTCVGVTMGQVLGEDQTQAELNKFHQAGAGVVLLNGCTGVDRFNQLLMVSSKPRGQLTSIYMKEPPTSIIAAKELVGTDIQQNKLEQLVVDIPTYEYLPTGGFSEDWYQAFEDFFEDYLPEGFAFEEPRYRIKIRLDPHALLKWGLTEISVVEAIEFTPGIVAIFSPTVISEIHVFILEDDHLDEHSWISQLHQYYIQTLGEITVAGIPYVEALHFKRETEGSDRWMALAEGERITRGNTIKSSVLRMINILSLDYVDAFLTMSNNVWDIVTIYGLESARELLIFEFLSCGDDVYSKNACHVELLVDIMIYTGRICAVSKNGVNPDTAEILLRASFEQVIPQFTTAAATTETDTVSSSSSAMINGSIPSVGTAINGLIMNQGM